MADDRRIAEALAEHLRLQGLPEDSGVSQPWVHVRWLGLPVVFPNFDARRTILVVHDVHHLLTGYRMNWRGEAEIGGFEIATGCRRFWAAWFFNFGGFLFGLVLAPRRTFGAFVRGRHCRNFYGTDPAAVLQERVGAARSTLGLDRPVPPPTLRDTAAFVGWISAALAGVLLLPVGALAVWVGRRCRTTRQRAARSAPRS